jgi:hypothetical protein
MMNRFGMSVPKHFIHTRTKIKVPGDKGERREREKTRAMARGGLIVSLMLLASMGAGFSWQLPAAYNLLSRRRMFREPHRAVGLCLATRLRMMGSGPGGEAAEGNHDGGDQDDGDIFKDIGNEDEELFTGGSRGSKFSEMEADIDVSQVLWSGDDVEDERPDTDAEQRANSERQSAIMQQLGLSPRTSAHPASIKQEVPFFHEYCLRSALSRRTCLSHFPAVFPPPLRRRNRDGQEGRGQGQGRSHSSCRGTGGIASCRIKVRASELTQYSRPKTQNHPLPARSYIHFKFGPTDSRQGCLPACLPASACL